MDELLKPRLDRALLTVRTIVFSVNERSACCLWKYTKTLFAENSLEKRLPKFTAEMLLF